MKKNHGRRCRNGFLLELVFAALLILGFQPNQTQAATLVHSNDLMGDIEPCGCRNDPLGGMARKANLVKRLDDPFVIQVDAGDLLYSTDQIPELLKDQSELQAEYLLRSMEKIHHQAIVPGEKDFALGFASFEKLRKKVKISILAANLYKPSEVKKSDPKPFYKPYEIVVGKDKNGKKVRVAILGLVGHTLVWPKELKALPAQKIAKKYISLLKKQADYVIALTHQGLAEDQELAKKVPGFDFIVGGHTQSFLQVPVQEGKTFILQSSFRNQYIGVAPLEKPFEKEHYKLIAVDAGYESPAEAPSEMDQFVKEFKHSIAELNSKQDEMLKNEVEAKTLAGKQVHFQTFPSCAECHLKQFDFWRKTDHANALTALVGKEQAQNKECLTCHTVGLGNPNGFNSVKQLVQVRKKGEDDEFTVQDLSLEDSEYFLKSIHKARSLKSDVKMSKEASEEIPMRKALSSVVKAWAPVQCENCHGPGKGHPFSGKYSKKVETSACLSCHTQDRAPDWYGQDGKPKTDLINSKRGLVSCPAGELAEEDE